MKIGQFVKNIGRKHTARVLLTWLYLSEVTLEWNLVTVQNKD
jgi:hypothetical protein